MQIRNIWEVWGRFSSLLQSFGTNSCFTPSVEETEEAAEQAEGVVKSKLACLSTKKPGQISRKQVLTRQMLH